MFSLGLTFANVNIMFNRSFQSMQKPWLPLYVGLVNLGLNALLDWVLLGPLGVAGITLSTSIVSVFNMVLLVWLLRRQIGLIGGRGMARSAGKAVLCALALAAVSGGALAGAARLRRRRVPAPAAVACRRPSGPAGSSTSGWPRLLKLEELDLAWRLLRRRGAAPADAAGRVTRPAAD